MIRLRITTMLACLAAVSVGLTGCGLSENTKKVHAEVERFHQHWNADEFQVVFDEAHMNFRNAQPASAMVETFRRLKNNYGSLKSTNRKSWGFNTDNGVTDIKVAYDSAYDRGSAVEEFVYRMTGDKPLLLSYDIASPETAAKREAEKKEAREEKRKEEEEKRKAEREARKKP